MSISTDDLTVNHPDLHRDSEEDAAPQKLDVELSALRQVHDAFERGDLEGVRQSIVTSKGTLGQIIPFSKYRDDFIKNAEQTMGKNVAQMLEGSGDAYAQRILLEQVKILSMMWNKKLISDRDYDRILDFSADVSKRRFPILFKDAIKQLLPLGNIIDRLNFLCNECGILTEEEKVQILENNYDQYPWALGRLKNVVAATMRTILGESGVSIRNAGRQNPTKNSVGSVMSYRDLGLLTSEQVAEIQYEVISMIGEKIASLQSADPSENVLKKKGELENLITQIRENFILP